jgi:hypothetical protein
MGEKVRNVGLQVRHFTMKRQMSTTPGARSCSADAAILQRHLIDLRANPANSFGKLRDPHHRNGQFDAGAVRPLPGR